MERSLKPDEHRSIYRYLEEVHDMNWDEEKPRRSPLFTKSPAADYEKGQYVAKVHGSSMMLPESIPLKELERATGRFRTTFEMMNSEDADIDRGISVMKTKIRKKRKSPAVPWKKPKGMPKRPLSAYNFFFQRERERMVVEHTRMSQLFSPDRRENQKAEQSSKDEKKISTRSHQKTSGIGFANLARTVGAKWKELDHTNRAPFDLLAAQDKERYDSELLVWRSKQKQEKNRAETHGDGSGNNRQFHLAEDGKASTTPTSLPCTPFDLTQSLWEDQSLLHMIGHQAYDINSMFFRVEETPQEIGLEPHACAAQRFIDSRVDTCSHAAVAEDVEIRSLEEMAADSHTYGTQWQRRRRQSAIETLGSQLDEDTVTFLKTLKYY